MPIYFGTDKIENAGVSFPTVTLPIPSISKSGSNIVAQYTPLAGYVNSTTTKSNSVAASSLDGNLLAQNIKSGVNIFGVTGTYAGATGGTGKQIAAMVKICRPSDAQTTGLTSTVSNIGAGTIGSAHSSITINDVGIIASQDDIISICVVRSDKTSYLSGVVLCYHYNKYISADSALVSTGSYVTSLSSAGATLVKNGSGITITLGGNNSNKFSGTYGAYITYYYESSDSVME